MDVLIGGVEGGASNSKLVLLDAEGRLVSEAAGKSTNHWQVGLEEATRQINDMVNAAKKNAGVDESQALTSLGLSLSGCDSVEARKSVETELKLRYPNLSKHYFVGCDTVAPIATVSVTGGVVLIAGTGSNCEVMHPDGSTERVGGWGHAIGDEGSASWITHYCLKQLFDTEDNLYPCKHDVSFVRDTMFKHFNVVDRMGMLEHLYTKFDKTFFSGMCRELARGAIEVKDPLCLEAFHKAGRHLGRHVAALSPRIDKETLDARGGLHIVCVGSVWKSWSIMKQGFLEGITPTSADTSAVKEFTLLELKKPATYGAAYLGAKVANLDLRVDSAANATAFFHHKQ